VFQRIRKLLFFLKLKREASKMKIDLTKALAILDGAIAIGESVASMTTSTRDDQVVAAIKAFREKFRPLFGAGEGGGTEDLPQAVADTVEAEFAKFEVVNDES
jgi:hypothetical protein